MSGALKSFAVGSAIGVTLAGSSLVAYRWWRRRRRPQNRLQRRLHHLREQMPDPSALLDHAPEVDLDARKGGGLGAAALALAGLVWLLRQRMGSETPLESLPMLEPEPTMQASHGLGPWVWLAASLASLGLGAALAWLFQRGANQPTHVGTQRVDSDLASDQHARR